MSRRTAAISAYISWPGGASGPNALNPEEVGNVKTKALNVRHTLIKAGSSWNERVEILRAGQAEPIHVLDRTFPGHFGGEVECAIQGLVLGDIIARRLAKKGEAVEFESNVPGAVALYLAAEEAGR
jgi:hypothetical protein